MLQKLWGSCWCPDPIPLPDGHLLSTVKNGNYGESENSGLWVSVERGEVSKPERLLFSAAGLICDWTWVVCPWSKQAHWGAAVCSPMACALHKAQRSLGVPEKSSLKCLPGTAAPSWSALSSQIPGICLCRGDVTSPLAAGDPGSEQDGAQALHPFSLVPCSSVIQNTVTLLRNVSLDRFYLWGLNSRDFQTLTWFMYVNV